MGVRAAAVDRSLDSAELMSVTEWEAFLSHVGLFESKQLSASEARLIFTWSRVRGAIGVASAYSDASQIRMRHLHFEDFLEALCRLSALLALPTDDDLEEVGSEDAGVYLMLLAEDPPAYRSFLTERRGALLKPPRQPIWRCVEHLVAYLARLVEHNTSGDKDLQVSAHEAHQFMKDRLAGKEFKRLGPPSQPSRGESTLSKALQAVNDRLLAALRLVEAFNDLPSETIIKLRDAMSDARFEAGETVFEQGEQGDAFYVILSGNAHVWRTNDEGEEQVLAQLSEGSYFGERALLREDVRYASVRAEGSSLRTKCITRAVFEASFGPLQDLLDAAKYGN